MNQFTVWAFFSVAVCVLHHWDMLLTRVLDLTLSDVDIAILRPSSQFPTLPNNGKVYETGDQGSVVCNG